MPQAERLIMDPDDPAATPADIPPAAGAPDAAPEDDSTITAAAAELLGLDQYSEYLLHSRREIVAVLRQVVANGDLVTLYFNSGKDFLLTTLLALDGDAVLLDHGSNGEMNRRALESGKIFCITRHDKVKLQFILSGVREAVYDGRKVFAATLPETLLRLQRREYFRLHTPIARPLLCNVPAVMPDGSVEIYPHNVIDLSIGGLSLQVGEIPFEAEQEWHDCSIELPEIGVINATLRVLNFYEITLRNGQRSQRAGCQFVDLPQTSQNLIQRYIVRMERERKARESGLA
ncbi:MAG TPA: flagellar brake protein [Rhodocyclaceae bacterium]|nr:flagellar brake protein [Rhodocyclaceae bacterium]